MVDGDGDERRIRQLLDMAAQAQAAGRSQEAERLLRQAQAEGPRHPLVLNEFARRLLLAGNPAGARELLERAVVAEPANPAMWLNLAAALRGLGLPAEELAALERVLAIEPRHARALLQKASLLTLQGQPRAAAATYRNALQTIPRGVDVPAPMRPAVEEAQRAVAANNRELEAFLDERLAGLRVRHAGAPLGRAERCLATLLQKTPIYRQQPTFLYFPQLPAIEFYERADFPWLDAIEAATGEIRAELVNVLADGPATLSPYVDLGPGVPLDQWRELNQSRRWGVYFLWKEGTPFPEHIARCPRTVAALSGWPRCEIPGCAPTAVFSILDAKTRIPAHTGVNNARLVVHLPLIVPPGCGFRVGAERREWRPGRAFVFDDTIEHEAWNDSDTPRAVLILDVWSPALSAAERDMVAAIAGGVGEYYGDALSTGL
jgi:aspartyl/asparaginyl beta-hydroxylase (cupin superfamily)